jgi:hypothetical protein
MSTNGHKAPPVRRLPQHGASPVFLGECLPRNHDVSIYLCNLVRLVHSVPRDITSLIHFNSSHSAQSRMHYTGVKGAYYAGHWVDLEDCAGTYQPNPSDCSGCVTRSTCPRSRSRNAASSASVESSRDNDFVYDVVIVGAGCIGGAIARELSRFRLRILLLESADDVSQGATKGNSGIVHAGYDDTPGSQHAKFCWKGNQMFPQLDRELRFGYQLNGSLVIATDMKERRVLDELMDRGRINGVERLRIVEREELFEMEPALNPKGEFGGMTMTVAFWCFVFFATVVTVHRVDPPHSPRPFPILPSNINQPSPRSILPMPVTSSRTNSPSRLSRMPSTTASNCAYAGRLRTSSVRRTRTRADRPSR